MRVLLIEDDSAMARSIELMLRSEGFNVYTTDLGEEGIDLGKLYDYDIIVLDLQLPDMSGFEVLKTLRLAKVQTPVLILSGNAIVEAKVKALGFGADDYMTKPFHKDELVARIQEVVRRSNLDDARRLAGDPRVVRPRHAPTRVFPPTRIVVSPGSSRRSDRARAGLGSRRGRLAPVNFRLRPHAARAEVSQRRHHRHASP